MEWYPTPSYLLKKRVILDYLAGISFRDFLEVGCGAGELLTALERRGYRGKGIDTSPEAVAAARMREPAGSVTVEQQGLAEIDALFDVIIASEVLEHCADDLLFLRQAAERMCPGGHLLLTVPAHMAKWGANDDFCGHLRRYERKELRDKMERAGLEPVLIHSYGVPVYNMMKPLYDRLIGKRVVEGEATPARTGKSGGMWLFTGLKGVFLLLFNDFTMYPFYLVQRLFYNSDIGNGYFAVGRKRP